jgi:hypothetical protein
MAVFSCHQFWLMMFTYLGITELAKCRTIGMSLHISLTIVTAHWVICFSNVELAYHLAHLDTCKMTGELDFAQAKTMAWSCSMLLKLYEGTAYCHFIAF